MKEVHKNLVVIDEAACDEGVRYMMMWHSVFIEPHHFIEPYLLGSYILLLSLIFAKNPHSEFSIVQEAGGVQKT
jgi:hypothetical protein